MKQNLIRSSGNHMKQSLIRPVMELASETTNTTSLNGYKKIKLYGLFMICASIYLAAKRVRNIQYFSVNICVISTPQHPVFCREQRDTYKHLFTVFSSSILQSIHS